MVYGFRLAPSAPNSDGRITCHPAILRSCKQVNLETTEMLAMSYQDKPPLLEITSTNYDLKSMERLYGAKVCLNGRLLAQGTEGSTTVEVPWPRCITKLRAIDMRLRLYPLRNDSTPSLEKHLRLELVAAGEAQVNYLPHDLYLRLHEESHLQRANVSVLAELTTTHAYLRNILSPVSGILGMVCPDSTTVDMYYLYPFPIDVFQRTAACLRRIHNLEEEALLERELRKELISRTELSDSIPALREGPNYDAIARCNLVGTARKCGSLYTTFAHPDELMSEIALVWGMLDEVEIELFEEGQPDMNDEVDQFRRMRTAWRANAGTE